MDKNMNNTQIPECRATALGSDKLVYGFYAYDKVHNRHLMITNSMHGLSETRIDETTLAIHFPDMLDSEGTKIFASLSEDGKGGDKYKHLLWEGKDKPNNALIAMFNSKDGFYLMIIDEILKEDRYKRPPHNYMDSIKVTGIQN